MKINLMFVLKVVFALVLALMISSAPVLALGPEYQETGFDLFAFAEFIKDFVLTSLTLGTLTAMLVNVFKPFIPDGYADTASVIVGFFIVLIVAVLKLLNPELTIAGVEELIDRILQASPVWLAPLTFLLSWLAGVIHRNFLAGLPVIGRSNDKPSIFSKDAKTFF